MSEKNLETRSNGGGGSNEVAEELAQVLGEAGEFEPVPKEIDVANELELLRKVIKGSHYSPIDLAMNLAGLLSVELSKVGVKVKPGNVRYIKGANNLGSGYTDVSDKSSLSHIPLLWDDSNDDVKKLLGDKKKLIGLIAGSMEVANQIWIEHDKGKIVVFVEKEEMQEDRLVKVVRVWADDYSLEYPGSELVGVYKFSYPLSSGPLDGPGLDAFGII